VDYAKPSNGLLLFFRVDNFDMALPRASALVSQLEEEPHVNPNTGTLEFSLRDLGGYYVTISALNGGALADGLEEMRGGVELLYEQNVLLFDGIIKIALAEVEALAGDPDRAIAILDEALATVDRAGYRAFEADLHRVRGETLLKRDPAKPAPAEEAFLTAISVAQRQATRSFELRAALALARLYQSTARPVEAHAVLAPALEGFSPTPEMPEIAEAHALLAG
jgi:predicted ATPase